MALDLSPRLAGTVATLIGVMRREGRDQILDPQTRAQLAELQRMLANEANRGQTRPAFDPGVLASQTDRMTPRLVTFERAGELLAYSKRTVRRLVRDGFLVTLGSGPSARIVVSSIDAYVDRESSVSPSTEITGASR
jgi:hypothetical protein